MSKYAKLIAAAIGLVLMAVKEFTGLNIGIEADQVMNVVIPLLTAVGVWAVPNE